MRKARTDSHRPELSSLIGQRKGFTPYVGEVVVSHLILWWSAADHPASERAGRDPDVFARRSDTCGARAIPAPDGREGRNAAVAPDAVGWHGRV